MIAYRLLVDAGQSSIVDRMRLLERVRPSSYVRVAPSAIGFDVLVRSTSRPFDDAHVVEAFEHARSLAMIVGGTMFDPIMQRAFTADELRQVDARCGDAHVVAVRERHREWIHVKSRGLVKFDLPELRFVVGTIEDVGLEEARDATELVALAATGIASGIYPEHGTIELLGETFELTATDGIALLERPRPKSGIFLRDGSDVSEDWPYAAEA